MHHSSFLNWQPTRWAAGALLAAALFLGGLPAPVQAQGGINVQLSATGASGVNGTATLTAVDQGTNLSLTLIGLAAGANAQVSLHGGTCAVPSASALRVLSLNADNGGRAAGSGRVQVGPSASMPLAGIADGDHVLRVLSGGQAVACGAVPALGNVDLTGELLAEGEHWQVMQFNPGAALQRRIFADGFVPNSAEFSATLEGTAFVGQRAEHLRSGAVRVYFVRLGDWGNVRFAQRGGTLDALGRYLLGEAENHQAIQFNPGAALQQRIFAAGFVPNSGEFTLAIGGISYTGQRAEHLASGRVRVYYAPTGQWNNVQYVERR